MEDGGNLMKKLLSLFLVIALSMSLFGCKKEEGTSTTEPSTEEALTTQTPAEPTEPVAPPEKIKLKAFVSYNDETRQKIYDNYYKVNVATELPEYDVEFEAVGSGYKEKLRVYNSSGDMPDVFWGDPVTITAGNALDFTPYITSDGFADKYVNKGALTPWKDGKIYAISPGSDQNYIPLIYYHKDMFDEMGIDIPTTYDEFVTASKKIAEKGIIPIVTPIFFQGAGFFQDMLISVDPKLPSDLITKTKKWTDPSIVDALTKMQNLFTVGAFTPESLVDDYGGQMELFKSKQAAMVYMYTWEAANFASDENVDIMSFPTIGSPENSKNVAVWGSPVNGFSVFSKSENVEAAVKLAEWLVVQDAKYFITEAKTPCSIDVGLQLDTPLPLQQKALDQLTSATSTQANIQQVYFNTVTQEALTTNLGKLFTNQMNPQEFAEAMDIVYADNE